MEKIGYIIRNHRISKGLTQKELGEKIFVSKQAVSKWETGKTLPDIETVRKLCDILEINKDEILGGSIDETKKNRKWLRICIAISIISILVALFFSYSGIDDYIDHHTQSGVAYLSVFSGGELVSTNDYQITSNLKFDNLQNAYKFNIDYGEIRGTIRFSDKYDIEFGFVNTNNWHNIHIRLDIIDQDGQLTVRQTVSYETENNLYDVLVTEGTTAENEISVFREGI